jgi:hypothetical protein
MDRSLVSCGIEEKHSSGGKPRQMTREHNWADNYTFSAAHIHRPGSVDEVRGIVARSTRIHAVGTRATPSTASPILQAI